MSRQVVEAVRCDFCGYGGEYTRPEDFHPVGDVDLCRWCANGKASRWVESGGHRVTFREGGGWDCDCGMSTDQWRVQSVRILTAPRVLAALPSFDNASATQHLEGRIR